MLKVFATCGVLATSLVLFSISSDALAGEVPQAVKDACSGDYKKHCNMHKPESDAARDCMAGAFEQLSDPCVSAILDSDLVDEQKPPAEQETRVAETGKANNTGTNVRRSKSRRVHHARAQQRRVTNRRRGAGQSKVAHYINRGTKLANFYVSKAFAKAFR